MASGHGEDEDRIRIGGEENCDHELRRVGTDGAYNIYFECTVCAGSIVKFSETDDLGDPKPAETTEPDLPQDPPTASDRTHPLVDGLTPDSNGSGEGPLEKLGSSLRDMFGDDREK